jgi:hypothetical protein
MNCHFMTRHGDMDTPCPETADYLVEMGESRTPRPEPSAEDHYECVRWFIVDRPGYHRQHPDRSSHVPFRALPPPTRRYSKAHPR